MIICDAHDSATDDINACFDQGELLSRLHAFQLKEMIAFGVTICFQEPLPSPKLLS